MKQSKQAIIFMGLQGSGKTWFYNHRLADTYTHINLDTLHTRNKERMELERCIAEGENIVIDNTNPTKLDRQRYIPMLKQAGNEITGYFFESRIKDCILRNERRTGKARVPNAAIAATSNKLEFPSLEEGFDELYFIARRGKTMMEKQEWRMPYEF